MRETENVLNRFELGELKIKFRASLKTYFFLSLPAPTFFGGEELKARSKKIQVLRDAIYLNGI